MYAIYTRIVTPPKHTKNCLVYTSYSEMERCAEIAFSAHQNAENEHLHKHKKQVKN